MKQSRPWFFELLKRIGTHRHYQVAFGLCLCGLLMIATSLILEKYLGLYLLWIIVAELGIACIIAAIAEFILLEHAKQIFQDEVRQGYKIVSHCWDHQLLDVMLPSEELNLACETKPARNGEPAEIRMLAFTLHDILPEESLWDVVKLHLDQNEKVKLRLLLVDPMSAAGRIRVMAEEGSVRPAQSELQSRVFLSIGEIQRLRKRAEELKKVKIEAGFCNVLPNFYMISTPTDLYIEPYHLGHKRRGHHIGRRMPLFRFSSKSEMYESASAHFDYLWAYYEHESAPTSDIQIKKIDDVERRRDPRRTKTSEADAERRVTSERRLKKAS